jgi:hypothetical protein
MDQGPSLRFNVRTGKDTSLQRKASGFVTCRRRIGLLLRCDRTGISEVREFYTLEIAIR